jgi:flavin-dependent dehydrogenase
MLRSTFETDVLIIGGGPSGSSTALGLLKYSDLSVTLLEQNDLNPIRVGEQVNASLFELLHYLGVSKEDFGDDCFLPGYGSYAAWGSPQLSYRHSVFSTQIDSFQLDREQFDLTLLEKAAAQGARVLPRTKAFDFAQQQDAWLVSARHPTEGDLQIKAKYLVDASGRQSHVGRKIGASFIKYDELVAVGAFLSPRTARPIAHEILLETVEDGWWYYAALPSNQVVVSLFTDAEIVKQQQLQKESNWCDKLAQTTYIKTKVSHTISNEKLWVRNAFSHKTETVDQSGFLAVGDAVASFDPISSMGIGFAISSACHAAKAIVDHAHHAHALLDYQNSITSIFNQYLETKSMFYKKEQRWNDSPFWKKRNAL